MDDNNNPREASLNGSFRASYPATSAHSSNFLVVGDSTSGQPSVSIPTGSNVLALAKPKITKSRNGCITCKTKRLKCDETKPTCQQCKKRNVDCGGYKKDFKWKAFEEESFTKPSPRRRATTIEAPKPQAKASPPALPTPDLTSATSTLPPSPSSLVPPTVPPVSIASPARRSQSPVTGQYGRSIRRHTSPYPVTHAFSPSGYHHEHNTPDSPYQQHIPSPTAYTSSDYQHSVTASNPAAMSMGPIFNTYTTSMPPPSIHAEHIPHFPQQSSASLSYHMNDYPAPSSKTDNALFVKQEQVNNIPGFKRQEAQHSSMASDLSQSWTTQPEPSPSSYASHGVNGDRQLEILKRGVSHTNQHHHIEHEELPLSVIDTCSILPYQDRLDDSPWRRHILPLMPMYPALHHAIMAMITFRAASRQPEEKPLAIEHNAEALRHLGRDMMTMPSTIALATTLALSFADSWDRPQSITSQYLDMGRSLVKKALDEINQGNLTPIDLKVHAFVLNTWLYLDIMTSLTCKLHSYSVPLADDIHALSASLGTAHRIDLRMKVAGSLLPLVGKVSSLVRRVRESAQSDRSLIAEADSLKHALVAWNPPLDPSIALSHPDGGYDEIINIAEAHRTATLLLLHQTLPEVPSRTISQMATKIIKMLEPLPIGSSSTTAYMFPLLSAGCEAKENHDRTWVMAQWKALVNRLQVGSAEKCFEVTTTVWKRRDEAAPQRSPDPEIGSTKKTIKLPKGSKLLQTAPDGTKLIKLEDGRKLKVKPKGTSTGQGDVGASKKRTLAEGSGAVGKKARTTYPSHSEPPPRISPDQQQWKHANFQPTVIDIPGGSTMDSDASIQDFLDPAEQRRRSNAARKAEAAKNNPMLQHIMSMDARLRQGQGPRPGLTYAPASAGMMEESPSEQHSASSQGYMQTQPSTTLMLSDDNVNRSLGSNAVLNVVDSGSPQFGMTAVAPRLKKKQSAAEAVELLPFECTVRGSHHWLGVMADKGWELLLA